MGKKAKKILILRPDNLGDIILFSGMLREIRKYYNNSKIIILVKRDFSDYVKLCPHVDEVLNWEDLLDDIKYSAISNKIVKKISNKKIVDLISKIVWHIRRNTKYKSDLLISPVRSVTGGKDGIHWVVSQLKSKEKIGISGDICRQTTLEDKQAVGIYSKRMHIEKENYWQHELITHMEYLKYIGVTDGIKNLWPELWQGVCENVNVEKLMPCNRGAVTIVVCPGSAEAVKNYPVEKYEDIFKSVDAIPNTKLILLGTKRDAVLCDKIKNSLIGCENITGIYNLAGKTSILQMMKVVEMSDLLLTVDTSVAHVGITLKKPTVAIVGGGHYGRFLPWGNDEILKVSKKVMGCFYCNWKCVYPEVRCIRDIPAKCVASNINYLLNKQALNNFNEVVNL